MAFKFNPPALTPSFKKDDEKIVEEVKSDDKPAKSNRVISKTMKHHNPDDLDQIGEASIIHHKTKSDILKEYGGVESNIPVNHKDYWKA